MSTHIKFGGLYRAQVYHGDTDILKYDTGWFNNVITNDGLNLLGTGWDYGWDGSGRRLNVGTNGAPGAFTDSFITNPAGSGVGMVEIARGHNVTTAPYYGWSRYSGTFGIGAIVGTIAEVGVGASATSLLSRAQLLNVGGAPITITLGGIDRLTITYELRQYYDFSDQAFTVNIAGVSTNCVCRHYVHSNLSHTPIIGIPVKPRHLGGFYINGTAPFIGANNTTPPSGTAVAIGYIEDLPYVANSYKNTAILGMTAGQGIVNNVTAMTVMNYQTWYGGGTPGGGSWQFSFNPPLSKTQYEDLRITFEMSWARI